MDRVGFEPTTSVFLSRAYLSKVVAVMEKELYISFVSPEILEIVANLSGIPISRLQRYQASGGVKASR
jgi:hypothetical protein